MKRALIWLIAFSSFETYASCYNDYHNNLESVNKAIEESNLEQARIEGYTVAGGLGLTTTATASGGSIIAFSTVSSQLIAAVYTGSLWMDLRISDETDLLISNKEKLATAISILKEARIGNGPFLQTAMPRVWSEVSSNISLGEVASKVVMLDDENAFCQGGQIASPAGILNLTIKSLK